MNNTYKAMFGEDMIQISDIEKRSKSKNSNINSYWKKKFFKRVPQLEKQVDRFKLIIKDMEETKEETEYVLAKNLCEENRNSHWKRKFFKRVPQLENQVDRLKKEKDQLKLMVYQLENKVNTLEKVEEKYESIKTIGNCFDNKVEFIRDFFKWIDNTLSYHTGLDVKPCVYGSFTRQFLEVPFALKHGFEDGYGDCRGRDLDIMIFDNEITSLMAEMYCPIIIDLLEEKLNNISNRYFIFGKYKIIKYTNVTITQINSNSSIGLKNLLNIPHYKLEFQNFIEDDEILEVDLFGWDPPLYNEWSNCDFDINDIKLYSNFLYSKDKYLLDILSNIQNKQAIPLIDTKNISDIAISYPLLRRPLYKQIVHFLINRTKIINSGYNIISNEFPDIDINRDEECFITCCEPPYIEMKLVCGHNLSIVAFLGLLCNNDTDSTYRLVCPLCRHDIELEFTSSLSIEANEELMGKDALLLIKNIMNNEKDDNSYPND